MKIANGRKQNNDYVLIFVITYQILKPYFNIPTGN